tara:strand:- start:262 stop:822 length:561 start_codon:yes stop_codon:yes gene_type:complete
MAKKTSKYKKITPQLKEKLRLLFVQGELDSQGFRRIFKIDDIATNNNVSVNTLYKIIQRENWKQQQEQFQINYQEKLDKQRIKEFSEESKKLDYNFLNIAKALLAKAGQIIRNNDSKNKNFTTQQLDQIASASLKIQKFAKLALGESTENMNINANIKEGEAFREAMELLDSVADERRKSDDSSIH